MADLMYGFDITQKKALERLGLSNDEVPTMTLAELITYVENLNAWAIALATKLNAQFVVANAETTLPFSPALAVDYDTNPQA